jgi:hypothetical protein
VRHEEAWKRLPDLLEDRDDAGLLAHVRACVDCQRQLFLLGRVDRLLRESASADGTARKRRPTMRRVLAAAAAVAAATGAGVMLLLFFAQHERTNEFMLRTASGRPVGQAVMGHSDARNVSLALIARSLPVKHGHVFVLWAGDESSSMQVGRFMVDRSGGCRVRFNLPATHGWHRFWVTEPGSETLVAST